MVRYRNHTRTTGRVGICLAFVSSIFVLTGPVPALAHESSPMYDAQNSHFTVPLSGAEIPGRGDADGQGMAKLDFDRQKQTACLDITWSRLRGDVTALHLHTGARGSEGTVWIGFFNDQHLPGAQHTFSNCVHSSPDQTNAVINNPAGYYLNVHSTEFPDGAIRGQLG
jgi:hypothetical protein